MKDSNRQIRAGALITYVTIGFNILAGLVYTPWMIQEIGQSDYGIYGLATSLIAMLSTDFGLGNATNRFLSKYIAEKNEKKVGEYIGVTTKLYLIIDLLIFVILVVCFAFMNLIYKGLTPTEIGRLRVVFVIAGFYTLVSFPFQPLNGILSANERYVFQRVLDLAVKVLTVGVMVVLLSRGMGLYSLVIVNEEVALGAVCIKIAYLKKEKLLLIDWKFWDSQLLREIFGFSAWMLLILIAENMLFNMMQTILGITSNSAEIAKFTAASTMEGYVFTLTTVIGNMFIPQVSRMTFGRDTGAGHSTKEISELMIRVGRIQLFISGAIISLFFVVGKEFVYLWLGPEFNGTHWTMLFLIVPIAIVAVQGIADSYVTVTGKINYTAYGFLTAAVVAISVALAVSGKMGAVGVAIGVGVGVILGRFVLMNWFYRKKLELDMPHFYFECYVKMLPALLIATAIIYILQKYAVSKGWFLFFGKSLGYAIIYCIAMWLLAFNKSEKDMVRHYLRKRDKKKEI